MQLRSQLKRGFAVATEDVAVSVATEEVVSPVKAPKKTRKTPGNAVMHVPIAVSNSDEKIVHRYPTLVPARLLRRYKRFLADVVLLKADKEEPDAKTEEITIYCPNTGPMVGLLDEPNARVQLSKSDDPKRKYQYTLEMIRIHNGERHVWVGVHSTSANYMVETALKARWFPELGAYDAVQREVKFAKNSRVDFVLSRVDDAGDVVHQTYVEVKSVTLAQLFGETKDERCAVFPDTVSTRAQKHVTELLELLEKRRDEIEADKTKKKATKDKTSSASQRVSLSGALVFVVQRDDCASFMPSLQHDKNFAQLCAQAEAKGVQLLAYACRLEPQESASTGLVRLLDALPLHPARAKHQ
ncbi:hypothetical protein Poli38472_012737 [Pythium oligandrum]|uniref:Sugar fermentation stimulation protein n=1 Tax=Pythium oligandrum TaxID=41045 RepID=A0A8K1FGE0_PYTOL|nr:hypothetical protein Poli38472_012737 [Pythium oligandrum]|eukprot:TMW61546.1 hypothetical protein Poli38472_012737 [Pythium oligandrum]